MTDGLLLMLGCAISFVALAGAYVALRSGFAHGFARRRSALRIEVARGPSRVGPLAEVRVVSESGAAPRGSSRTRAQASR